MHFLLGKLVLNLCDTWEYNHVSIYKFKDEVKVLNNIRCRNIITLWCCCDNSVSKLLVYKYIANKILDDRLNKSLLDWPTRYKIAVDIAKRECYLLHNCVLYHSQGLET